MLIHIDRVEVLVPKRGSASRGWDDEVGDDTATINVDWWETDETGCDGIAYSSGFDHPVATLGDLQAFVIGKPKRMNEGDWVEFQYYLTAEYGMLLLNQREKTQDAELWQAPYRQDFDGDDVSEYYYSVVSEVA